MFFFFKDGRENKNDELQEYIKEKLYYLEKIKELQERRSTVDMIFNNFFDKHMEKIEKKHKEIENYIKKINPKLGKKVEVKAKEVFKKVA